MLAVIRIANNSNAITAVSAYTANDVKLYNLHPLIMQESEGTTEMEESVMLCDTKVLQNKLFERCSVVC